MNYPAQRRRQLARLLKEENVDALLVTNPVNVTYLTGFSGDSTYLILGRQHTLLVSDGRFTEQLAEECPGLDAYIRPSKQSLSRATADTLQKLGPRQVGFESGNVSVADLEVYREMLPAIEWKGVRDRVEKMRAVKDESEVAAIREAIRIAERAFAMFRSMLRRGDCEKDLHDAMEGYIRRAGGRCSSFPTIVAVDERAALPHAPPTGRNLAECHLLLVDWGASGAFYKSDLTRVLIPRNHSAFSRSARQEKADEKLEKVYATVLAAQQAAIAAVRPGAKGHDVDAIARAVMDEAGYGKYFMHGLGHGIGLQVHEAPAVRTDSVDVLQAGMVVTIEPGIYLPGWGGVRLEDDVLVTPDGNEVLTSVPKDFASQILDFGV
ncbi:MAG: Xaa-Pro peptidase family protein [Gemmataceae bacterium]|nr:Xaa-Pro peptidase family protein [Gemmataceae bacterium]